MDWSACTECCEVCCSKSFFEILQSLGSNKSCGAFFSSWVSQSKLKRLSYSSTTDEKSLASAIEDVHVWGIGFAKHSDPTELPNGDVIGGDVIGRAEWSGGDWNARVSPCSVYCIWSCLVKIISWRVLIISCRLLILQSCSFISLLNLSSCSRWSFCSDIIVACCCTIVARLLSSELIQNETFNDFRREIPSRAVQSSPVRTV